MKAFSSLMKEAFGNQGQHATGLVGQMLQIGAYRVRVEGIVGEGGYATIYKVRDQGTGVAYALKVVRVAGNSEFDSLVQICEY